MSYQLGKEGVYGKTESTPGTYETLAAADNNVHIFNPSIKPILNFEGSRAITGNISQLEDIVGASWAEIKFTVKLNNGGAVNTEPNYAKFMKACGARSQVEGTNKGWSFNPHGDNDKTPVSLAYYFLERGASAKALLLKYKGCCGNCVVKAAGVGKSIEAEFTFMGAKSAHADVATGDVAAALALTSPHTALPYVNLNTSYIFGTATAQYCSAFELDFGNTVEPEIDPSVATSGVYMFAIGDRRPTLKINPTVAPVATLDIITQYEAMTSQKVAITNGSTIPFKITCPKAEIIEPAFAPRESLSAWDLQMKLLQNGYLGSLVVSDMPLESAWELLIGAKA